MFRLDLLEKTRLNPKQMERLLLVLSQSSAVAPDIFLPMFGRSVDETTRPKLAEFFQNRLVSGWAPSPAAFDQVLRLFPDWNKYSTESNFAIFSRICKV